jgi:antitoxin component HigA of HigAB toxin-antitoxin module
MTKSYQDLRAGMSPESIKSAREKALKMLEEQRYIEDLQELSLLFDKVGELDSDQEARFEELVTRIELHEDKYYPIHEEDSK